MKEDNLMKKTIATILTIIMLFTLAVLPCCAQTDAPFYLVLGDSIAYGSGLNNPVEACYGKIVADTNGYEYSNRSVPGHTSTALIGVMSREDVIEDIRKADIINISIGGNDFLTNNIIDLMFNAMVKKDYSRFDSIAEGFYSNLTTILEIINTHNEDAVVLIQSLYNPQSGHIRPAYQQGADRINEALYRFSENNPGEIVIVDVASALGDDMANFAADEIHPSAKGNEIIAQQVLDTLYGLGLGKSTTPVIAEKGSDFDRPLMFSFYVRIFATVFHVLGVIRGLFV